MKDSLIDYTVRKSSRAKRIRITIRRNKEVILIVPRFTSIKRAEKFLNEKSDWILSKLSEKQEDKILLTAKNDKRDFLQNKLKAYSLIQKKVEKFNGFYGFKYNKICIRNQKTRWGSCSSRGNLNFNYKLIYLPEKLIDYVVVHELCHLGQMNHSKKFWELVALTVDDYMGIRTFLMLIKMEIFAC